MRMVFKLVAMLFSAVIIGAVGFFFCNTLNKNNAENEKMPTQEIITDMQSAKMQSDKNDSEDTSLTLELSEEEILEKQTEEILHNMSLDEKIYQLFVVTPEMLTGVSQVVAAGKTTKNGLKKAPVGGLIYLSSNFVSKDQTKEMLSNTQKNAEEIEGIPLFLCVDEEGGRVTRIAQNSAFNLKKLGAMAGVKSTQEAYDYGNTIGAYLKELGLNVDFAPDADVLTNSSNTVIGDRSFGSDPVKVSDYAKAYSDGLHNQGILSTYKHFPGHGATEADTHEGYAYTKKSYDELLKNELVPFIHAEEYGIDMVMISHISLPNVIGDDTPSTLSYKITTELLRNNLSYKGIIITDALNMGAITEKYSSSEAAVLAFQAGSDLLLMPEDLNEAHEGILNAVKNGSITEERINESVKKIIKTKLLI